MHPRLRLGLVLALALPTSSAFAESDLLILTSDFATGSTAHLPAGSVTAEINLLAIHADAVGTFQAGRIYVINRLGQDNVLVLDPADIATPIGQFSTGNGSNPHDIEILSEGKAYVTRHNSVELMIVDPRDGAEIGTVDLSDFADTDGLPEMSQIVRLGDFVYVACQRLDRANGFAPFDARLAVIDPVTDTLVGSIVLSATNPNSLFAVGEDRLVVSGSAGFGDRAGGIDIVAVDNAGSGASTGFALGEDILGGDISLLALRTATAGFAVVLDESFANTVVPVDLASGQVGPPLEGLSGGFIPSLVVDGDRLLVADQGSFSDPASAGLKVFDAVTGVLEIGPIDTGLPPAGIVVLDESPITAVRVVDDTAVPAVSRLRPGYPNPFNASVQVVFDVAGAGGLTLIVHDALGRSVRTLHEGPMPPGRYATAWDGRDDVGRSVGNGVYLVRLRTAEQTATVKVTLLE
jgi:hypothetical protein